MIVTALYADNYDLLVPAGTEFIQSPGFTVCGIFITEQIVSVEEVHDRERSFSMIRHPYVKRPVRPQ